MDTLFEVKELSRSQKLKKSKGVTAALTQQVIDYLNANGFTCHRSNNFPSQRITREKAYFKYQDSNDDEQVFEYDKVEIHFKKNNVKNTVLDISGFRNDGIHCEIEVKTGKDTLSDEQIKRIDEIKKAGGISFSFSSMETFLMQIEKYLPPRKLAF